MSTTIKKIIKYGIIVALLGAIVFFGVRLLFPTPSPTLAFEKTTLLSRNENFQKNKSVSERFISKYSNNLSAEKNHIDLLNHSNLVINFQKEMIDYVLPDLAFATNSSVYNSKAKELEKLEKEISSLLSKAANYSDHQFEPVYNQSGMPANNTLKAILSNLNKNNNAIANKMKSYIETTATIYLDLEQTFTANPYSKKTYQIISVWISAQTEFLNNQKYIEGENHITTNGLKNLEVLKTFKSQNLSHSKAVDYITYKSSFDAFLKAISKADIIGLLNRYEFSDTNLFIEAIENEEIKASTKALNDFIKGVQ